jgi:hypothetical protein
MAIWEKRWVRFAKGPAEGRTRWLDPSYAQPRLQASVTMPPQNCNLLPVSMSYLRT